MKILLIEDEKRMAQSLCEILRQEKYEVDHFANGLDGLAAIESEIYDIVILDVMLPGMNGFEIAKRARREGVKTPILMLTAKAELDDKVEGLDSGADDYLTKPFGTAELLARVRTAIRHTRTTSPTGEIAQRGTYSVGEMVIDYNKHQVLVRGENVRLTLSEFRIVALLGKFAGKVLTYDYIIKELWGPRAGGDNQILRVNMANIRRKIEKNPAEPEYLFTEVGVGYRMAENPSGE